MNKKYITLFLFLFPFLYQTLLILSPLSVDCYISSCHHHRRIFPPALSTVWGVLMVVVVGMVAMFTLPMIPRGIDFREGSEMGMIAVVVQGGHQLWRRRIVDSEQRQTGVS